MHEVVADALAVELVPALELYQMLVIGHRLHADDAYIRRSLFLNGGGI